MRKGKHFRIGAEFWRNLRNINKLNFKRYLLIFKGGEKETSENMIKILILTARPHIYIGLDGHPVNI